MVHTELTPKEVSLKNKANTYVCENKENIVNRIAGDNKFISKGAAISIFMAGSPGSGKTETSKAVLAEFDNSPLQSDIIRLDPDSIRGKIPQYEGGNAHVFQQPITYITNQVFNHAIKTNKNILVDGTFSNHNLARQNIKKSLNKNRSIHIIYLYVDPISAWNFTQAREKKEGRRITKQVFIDALFNSKQCVKDIQVEFGKQVAVIVGIRDYEEDQEKIYQEVTDIDKYVKIPYSKEELSSLI